MKLGIVCGCALVLGMMMSSAAAAAEAPLPAIEPDVVYGHKDGLALTMDIFRPAAEPNGATILFIVSGGWYSHWTPAEQAQAGYQPYLKEGFNVIAIRHGSSPRYGIPDAVSDVRRAVRYLHQHAERLGVDPERFGVLGTSAGGHLALMLGTTGDDGKTAAKEPIDEHPSRVAAVVALVPPTDLRVAVWEAPDSLPAYRRFPALDLPLKEAGIYSPLVQVSADDAPSLVIMGGSDELVPAKHGEWIAEAFKKEEVTHKLIVIPGADHGLGGAENRALASRETLEWFERHLVSTDSD